MQPRNEFSQYYLHWIAHFQGQVNKTEARPRKTCQGRGRGQHFGLDASLASRP